MLITPELIEDYKQNPRGYDFDKGKELGGIDYFNDTKIVFTDKHSQAFRDGYVRGYCSSKQDATEDIYDCDTPDKFWGLFDSYHKSIEDLQNELESQSLRSYYDVPDFYPPPDFERKIPEEHILKRITSKNGVEIDRMKK